MPAPVPVPWLRSSDTPEVLDLFRRAYGTSHSDPVEPATETASGITFSETDKAVLNAQAAEIKRKLRRTK